MEQQPTPEAPSEEVADLVDDVVHIRTIPSTLAEIRRVARDPEHDTAAMVEVLERDPPIAAQCLHLANSPLYGLRHRTSSLAMACMVLGVRGVENLVLQAIAMDLFLSAPESEHLRPEELWETSQRTALAARHLAAASPRAGDADEAYTCGLLRELGKILLLQERPEELAQCAADATARSVSLEESIERHFGFADWMVLQRLAERWKLGDAIRHTARPSPAPEASDTERQRWALVEGARRIARSIDDEVPDTSDLGEILGVEPEVFEWVHDEVAIASAAEERRRERIVTADS